MTIMYLRRTQSVYPVEFVEGHKIVIVFIRFYTKEHIDLCAHFCVNDPARRDIRSRERAVSEFCGYHCNAEFAPRFVERRHGLANGGI